MFEEHCSGTTSISFPYFNGRSKYEDGQWNESRRRMANTITESVIRRLCRR